MLIYVLVYYFCIFVDFLLFCNIYSGSYVRCCYFVKVSYIGIGFYCFVMDDGWVQFGCVYIDDFKGCGGFYFFYYGQD